jgi:hypothetical protein
MTDQTDARRTVAIKLNYTIFVFILSFFVFLYIDIYTFICNINNNIIQVIIAIIGSINCYNIKYT